MDVVATLAAAATIDSIRPYVEDLDQYPQWIDLVHRAERVGTQPTWAVELRARVGPLARSKRLRMTRTVNEATTVVFEREEVDGRSHSPWVLRAEFAEGGTVDRPSTLLTMRLHYGGGLWTGGVLERVLADQIRSGQRRLASLVEPTR